jgi:hypothetical protein
MLGSYDLSIGVAPVDLALAAQVGKRVSLSQVRSITIVLIKAAGTAGEDPVVTLKQHTAATGGVTSDLAVIDRYWVKSEATLDGDETWTEVAQAAAATITDPGAAGVSAESQQLVAIDVRADQLAAGNGYISLDVADVGLGAQLSAVLYIVHTADRRGPARLSAPLR